MKISKLYEKTANKKFLYNIMPLDNIPSVIRDGIVSYYEANKIEHKSIAMDEIQKRREKVKVNNGAELHKYANLYFTYNNPMLYRLKNRADEFCVLAVDISILDTDGCILTDRNASSGYVQFYEPIQGIKQIEFDKVFSQYWYDEKNSYAVNTTNKAIKCAEILIPNKIPYDYVVSACVKSNDIKEKLLLKGFKKKIIVEPRVFYL